MTKFEEDLNKKMDLKEVPMYFTQSGCSITRKTYIETNWIFDNYKNWHSDEEFQAKEKEIKRLRKINHLYKKAKGNAERMAVNNGERLNQAQDEIASLKSQLQQQALPVVKDFVAEWYEGHKDDLDFEIYYFCCDLFKTKSEFATWFGNAENNSISTLIRMQDGYTVEKPQLFYLKHIDMSKRDKDHDYFAQIRNDRFEHDSVRNNTLPGVEVVGVKFTQQEIDSMQTGSYEQIEVAE